MAKETDILMKLPIRVGGYESNNCIIFDKNITEKVLGELFFSPQIFAIVKEGAKDVMHVGFKGQWYFTFQVTLLAKKEFVRGVEK